MLSTKLPENKIRKQNTVNKQTKYSRDGQNIFIFLIEFHKKERGEKQQTTNFDGAPIFKDEVHKAIRQ